MWNPAWLRGVDNLHVKWAGYEGENGENGEGGEGGGRRRRRRMRRKSWRLEKMFTLGLEEASSACARL